MSSLAIEPIAKFKIAIVGDPGVGKTCIFARYSEGTFSDSGFSRSAAEATFTTTLTVDSEQVKLTIVDTGDQDKFKNVTASYYRGVNAFLLCFSLANRDSFEGITGYFKECNENAFGGNIKILVGTKLDLVDQRAVTDEDAKATLKKLGITTYMEISSKNNTNVDQLFVEVTRSLLKDKKVEDGLNDKILSPRPKSGQTDKKKRGCILI